MTGFQGIQSGNLFSQPAPVISCMSCIRVVQ